MEDRRSLPPHDDFARALLRSAEQDEPSSVAYAKVATALGVVGTAVGVAASAPAPAALATGAAAASNLVRWSGSVAAKLAVFGVSGALLLGAGVAFLRHHRTAGRAAQPLAAVVKVAVLPAPSGNATASAAESALSAPAALPFDHGAAVSESASEASVARSASSLVGAVPPRAHAALARATAHDASSASSLPAQVQSLDRARVALSSGDPGAALVEVAYYRKNWPKGVFLTEASVLEIEALAKRGERSLAATRARAFVDAHPDSPQVERLRALIPADHP